MQSAAQEDFRSRGRVRRPPQLHGILPSTFVRGAARAGLVRRERRELRQHQHEVLAGVLRRAAAADDVREIPISLAAREEPHEARLLSRERDDLGSQRVVGEVGVGGGSCCGR